MCLYAYLMSSACALKFLLKAVVNEDLKKFILIGYCSSKISQVAKSTAELTRLLMSYIFACQCLNYINVKCM